MKSVVEAHPKAKLLIAGNGPEKERIEAEISSLGLTGSVIMLGYCTHLEDYQQICDLSVACSFREGLGLNVIESLLSGNPVAGTKNRGHNELVKDRINGFLVNPNDVNALAESVNLLLSDSALLDSISSGCRESVKSYTAENVSAELEKIYFGQ